MNTWNWIADQLTRSSSLLTRGVHFYGAGLRSYVEPPEHKKRRVELEAMQVPLQKIQLLSDHKKSFDPKEHYYWMYIPKKLAPSPALVVMVHGCLQTPHEFALATGIHEAAEKEGFAVLFPDQSEYANPLECWNWQDPENQERGAGEAKRMVDMIRHAIKKFHLDKSRVYGAGLSSGGSMIHILVNTYPEVFAASMAHSAPGFKTASSMLEGLHVMMHGSDHIQNPDKSLRKWSRKAPMLIVHGADDKVVHVKTATQSFEQIKRLNELLDDTRSAPWKEEQTPQGKKLVDVQGHTIVELRLVNGLGHAWGGGVTPTPHSNMNAPDSTKAMLRFFKEHGF